MQTLDSKQSATKPYKGVGMNGFIARWYAKTTLRDLADFQREARDIAAQLKPRADVLEVAPGPGYFSLELAQLGRFNITGLDISETFVELARTAAREKSLNIDFRLGNASAMPFPDASFDFIFCRAAFKNFSQPVEAINEMHRVLRPGGRALIVDLRKDVPMKDVDAYFKKSGRGPVDTMLTTLTFRHCLLKRAYTAQDFRDMAARSRFGSCTLDASGMGFNVHFQK